MNKLKYEYNMTERNKTLNQPHLSILFGGGDIVIRLFHKGAIIFTIF